MKTHNALCFEEEEEEVMMHRRRHALMLQKRRTKPESEDGKIGGKGDDDEALYAFPQNKFGVIKKLLVQKF